MLAPAGALALCPQTLSGYTGTSIPLAPAPSSTGFRAGPSPANKQAGQGWSLEAGRVGNQGVREGDEGPPESISCEPGWVLDRGWWYRLYSTEKAQRG